MLIYQSTTWIVMMTISRTLTLSQTTKGTIRSQGHGPDHIQGQGHLAHEVPRPPVPAHVHDLPLGRHAVPRTQILGQGNRVPEFACYSQTHKVISLFTGKHLILPLRYTHQIYGLITSKQNLSLHLIAFICLPKDKDIV